VTEMWHFVADGKLRGGGVDYKHKIVDPHEARKGDGHMINIVIHDDLLPHNLKVEDILDAIEIQQVSSEALEEDVRHWRAQVGPDVSDLDTDMAERLSEMLRAGEMVAGHLERVLNRPEPIPNWLLIKLNELQGLLHGRTDRIDVYFPGLNRLLDDLYTKHFEEEKNGQNPGF
jgi:hypothetical protein